MLEDVRCVQPRVVHEEAVAISEPMDEGPVVCHSPLSLQVLIIRDISLLLIGAVVENCAKLNDVAKSNHVKESLNLRDVDDMGRHLKTWKRIVR